MGIPSDLRLSQRGHQHHLALQLAQQWAVRAEGILQRRHRARATLREQPSGRRLNKLVFGDTKVNWDLKREHETQVRPLIGLNREQTRLAWQCAAEMAGGGKITARLVKTAVQEISHLAGKAAPIV